MAIVELRAGKIWRDTRYFGDPLEAPACIVSTRLSADNIWHAGDIHF